MKSLMNYFSVASLLNAKKTVLRAFSTLSMILIAALVCGLFGQSGNPFDGDTPNPAAIINWYQTLLAGLTLVWGETAKALGIKAKVKEIIFVVIAGGIAIAGVLINFGLVDSIPALFTILTSLGLFDLLKASKNTIKRYFPWA